MTVEAIKGSMNGEMSIWENGAELIIISPFYWAIEAEKAEREFMSEINFDSIHLLPPMLMWLSTKGEMANAVSRKTFWEV